MTSGLRLFARRLAIILGIGVLIAAPRLLAQRATGEGGVARERVVSAPRRPGPLAAITRDNVKDLTVLWRWQAADRALQASTALWRSGRNEDTPLMVNGTVYAITGLGMIAAIDPASATAPSGPSRCRV